MAYLKEDIKNKMEILDEDNDEFEEFVEDDWDEKAMMLDKDDAEEVSKWNDDWEDEDDTDEFSKHLKEILMGKKY